MKDLMTGKHVCETRSEGTFLVLEGFFNATHKSLCMMRKDGRWTQLDEYTKDLRCPDDKDFDIMKVWELRYTNSFFNDSWKNDSIIYERPEPRKITISEIKYFFGNDIEIVAG